jgi:hypothetical protein
VRLLKPVEEMVTISLEELANEQAKDTWCQDMLHMVLETGDSPSLQEFRWNANGVLSCRNTADPDAPLRWLAPPMSSGKDPDSGSLLDLGGTPRIYQDV